MSDRFRSNSPSLDPLKNNRNNFCCKWSVRGKIESEGNTVWRYARLGCKQWNCPRCGPRRVKQLRHAIVNKAQELNLTRFLTLTLNHKSCTPEESVEYIRNCWNKFRIYLKRKHGKSISFITILEPQKSGHAHLHILVDRYIDRKWISNKWSAIGGGHIVDIRQVDIHRVSLYLSKYLTRELLLSSYFTKYRRYTTSRDIVLFAKSPKGDWILITVPLEFLFRKAIGGVLAAERDDLGIVEWFNVLEPL